MSKNYIKDNYYLEKMKYVYCNSNTNFFDNSIYKIININKYIFI